MDIFEEFTPKEVTGKNYKQLNRVFESKADINFSEWSYKITANMDGLHQTLYDVTDFLNSTKKWNRGTIDNLKGFLGERIMSITMGSFLKKVDNETMDDCFFGVLREKSKTRGKGYVARYNDDYLLKFKGVSNFVLLEKDKSSGDESIYKQEKFGMLSTEIDGLGYFHTPNQKYLLVGESTTKKEFEINSWSDKEHIKEGVENRIFNPLKSLFPNHKLIYFVMSPVNTIYYKNKGNIILKKSPEKIYSKLKENDVGTVFIPIPKTTSSLEKLAENIAKDIPLARILVKNLK